MTAEFLGMSMFAMACLGLLIGYNVAFTLAGISILFAALGTIFGVFDPGIFFNLPERIYPIITREMLIAVPLFVFMGVMLEKSKIAEELLDSMGNLLGPLKGGLGISVVFVGALLAASTGIVGATVVTMGLLSLPTMLKRQYSPSLASGAIAASGTLGQIIPPSIVLVILGDQISNANTKAQQIQKQAVEDGTLSANSDVLLDKVVSVGDLFAGALYPGLILVGFYALYIATKAYISPASAPSQDWPEDVNIWLFLRKTLIAMLPPILLIIAVLGSILVGYATPTRGAALGALGAILLAAHKTSDRAWVKWAAMIAIGSMLALVTLDISGVDMRANQEDWTSGERVTFGFAVFLFSLAVLCILAATKPLLKSGQLADVSRKTLHITSMVFAILIGATIFSLVFTKGFGGDELVSRILGVSPSGDPAELWRAFALVMSGLFPRFYRNYFCRRPARSAAFAGRRHGSDLAGRFDGA